MFNETIAEVVSSILPYALLLHLIFGMWAYGNGDIFSSSDTLDKVIIIDCILF